MLYKARTSNTYIEEIKDCFLLKNVNLNINVEGPVISCFKKSLLKFSAMTEIAASSFSKSKLENAFFITNLKSLYLIVTMLNAIKDCRSFQYVILYRFALSLPYSSPTEVRRLRKFTVGAAQVAVRHLNGSLVQRHIILSF